MKKDYLKPKIESETVFEQTAIQPYDYSYISNEICGSRSGTGGFGEMLVCEQGNSNSYNEFYKVCPTDWEAELICNNFPYELKVCW